MEVKRSTAIKTRIKSLTDGKFVASVGFTPGYVLTNLGTHISRARILGTVVHKFVSEDKKFASITIDDRNATIRARVFGGVSMIDDIDIGNIVDMTGKLKEYQAEIYIMPEVIMKIDDPNVEILRELELAEQEMLHNEKRKIVFDCRKQTADLDELKKLAWDNFGISAEEVEAILQSTEPAEPAEDGKEKEKVLELIEKLDAGGGCDYSELVKSSGIPEDALDSVINDLLNDGLCFEPKPGKIKKL
ncbi:MAG: OB-fold nucleic acid binding domain-containing protein [Candidatus Aenigmatarchaeota archaeon]